MRVRQKKKKGFVLDAKKFNGGGQYRTLTYDIWEFFLLWVFSNLDLLPRRASNDSLPGTQVTVFRYSSRVRYVGTLAT